MNKTHCKNHKEYHVETITLFHKEKAPKQGESEHCPDCQRALAEFWVEIWGWKLSPIGDLMAGDSFYWYLLDSNGDRDEKCLDIALVETVLSPDGMLKAWEWCEEREWNLVVIDMIPKGQKVRFRKLEDIGLDFFKITTKYQTKKYGKVVAIMLAASEAVNNQEVEG